MRGITALLRRLRVRRVYRDRHGVLHTHLDGMPIRIGVVPDPPTYYVKPDQDEFGEPVWN